jgi:DNA-binding FrmR family transcriptional regulator
MEGDINNNIDHEHAHPHPHPHPHAHTHDQCHAHDHAHTHDPQEMKAIINRLSRAIGHLESVKRMVENGKDCSEVLIQLAAVKAAINNTGKEILKEHITHCIIDAVEENDLQAIEELNNAIDKFIK